MFLHFVDVVLFICPNCEVIIIFIIYFMIIDLPPPLSTLQLPKSWEEEGVGDEGT